MNTDVLSDVLRAVRLSGVIFFDFELSSPWVAEAPPSHEIASLVLPGCERVMEYHLLSRGTGWGHAVGEEPRRLREGDLLLFPQGHAHVLSSEPGMRASPNHKMFARGATPLPFVYELGGGGHERARVICGFLGCDEKPYNPLLSALPSVIHLSANEHQGAARPLGTMLEIALNESKRGNPGSENVLARLSELTFVEAIRRYLVDLPDTQRGWLAGLRDPIVGGALKALHGAPQNAWTVENLGRTVGVSRSVMAARFTEMVGQAPMQYLALWRMQLAARMLHEGRPVAAVAGAVGYESEAAFSRTFKKLVGDTPAAWRRRR